MSDNGTDRKPFADGLRALADIIEANPDVPLTKHAVGLHWNFSSDRDKAMAEIASIVRAFPHVDKDVTGDDFGLVARLHGLRVQLYFRRRAVCEQREVTKTVTEWHCPDSLLALTAAADDAEVPA